ncbi:hypothetical protein GO755_12740 [Spirosoma sp. HMF4905]|uniref:Uncharacterized protein n=1 Tax=Spirosoma arboris TaxID=2682092 RepID=A0A7K1SAU5_9BACT|nr:class I lanthipeptide [Spirosoma arboris]MVM30901.1 hypothetical protein [Spirosoma arboris]
MKKQVSKITLKTDTIVSLSKAQAQNVVGGAKCNSRSNCSTAICSL